ncbi:MAG: 30S ribosomal protein S3 [Gammaproteobacteria bacterium]|nr:30S ribosomal protein S3 [Gammaproteobacteria bacterium]|tara:strand:+ start:935 stop:1594 length:660 start_codon:yes stop_codon:yes gene_type:complete
MGQKVHPIGFRLGVVTDWTSKWYAEKKEYAIFLKEDLKVKDFLKTSLSEASVSRITIERPTKAAEITIHTARPGIVIGKKGEDVEILRKKVSKIMNLNINNVKINIEEIRKPEINAQLVSEGIASQIERRVMYRRAMKRAVQNSMRLGALGVKVNIAGRLNGAEIARSEWYREGRVPLHTIKANIDYGFSEAKTTYGIIGIKTWIFTGESEDEDAKEST